MNCETIKELISPYIDAELERVEIIQVEKHIEKCEKCKKLLIDYQNISYSIRSIPIPRPSEKVLKRILMFPRRRVYLLRRLALSASFMVILASLMIPLLRTEEKIAEENPKEYYIVREEKTPYTEVYYEREGNFVLTSYSGGSF
jgi:predicted anti-sigma-YlaC factor YlaD